MCCDKYSQYDKKYVFFIDILGFKNKIENSKTPEEIINIIDILRNDFYRQKNKKTKLNLNITQVSDCIVISFPKDTNFEMFQMLMIISYVQINAFIKHGLLLRGACTFDNIIHDEKYLFGKAYQNAYLLEEKKALYPRIIFPKTLIDNLSNGEKLHCMDILNNDDEYYYIDIFKNEIISSDNIQKQKELLEAAKKIINENIQKYNNILNKYNWLKESCNITIEEFNNKYNENVEIIK